MRSSVPGSPPSLIDLPTGCPFHPRCAWAMDICREQMPDMIPLTANHKVACWLSTASPSRTAPREDRAQMDKLLEVERLTKVFTLGSLLARMKITAVDNVSFFIKPAEIFTLAGESGCGKTTTARIILGFEEQTSGDIIHSGKVVDVSKGQQVWFTEGIQAIFQDPFSTFNPLRTVDSYFFDTVRNYKLAASRRRCDSRD